MSASRLLETLTRYAESQGFKINPDRKIVESVLSGLLANEAKFGYRYCVCRAITGDREQDKKIICPCAYHKKEIRRVGRCLCGLFVAKV